MNREKQIEEMARKMCRNYQPNGSCAADDDPCQLECVYGYCAERIYCAGYRKQVKGKWIVVGEPRMTDEGIKIPVECSCCSIRRYIPNVKKHGYYYCPNCGAKMKGE